jgi:hypothetical protein
LTLNFHVLRLSHTNYAVVLAHTQSILHRLQFGTVFLSSAVIWDIEHIESFVLPVLDGLHIEVFGLGRHA